MTNLNLGQDMRPIKEKENRLLLMLFPTLIPYSKLRRYGSLIAINPSCYDCPCIRRRMQRIFFSLENKNIPPALV